MTSALKPINLALAFILELAMLAAFAYWGFRTGSTGLAKGALGVGVPLIVALIWGMFMAPRAARRLKGASYFVLKGVLFLLATLGLAVAGQVVSAIIFVVLTLINTALQILWRQ